MKLREEHHKEIRRELQVLSAGGKLTPDCVIEKARERKNPMHTYFEWDDRVAGHKYRQQQARELISSFTIISSSKPATVVEVQEFVRDPRLGPKEQGYVEFFVVKQDRSLSREFIEQELKIAESHVHRAYQFAEALGLRKKIKRVVDDLAKLRASV